MLALALSSSQPARAAESALLDHYLEGLTSLHTAFTQTVTDARGQKVDGGSGELLVQRPGKFRWDYVPLAAGPKGEQLLIGDGRNLWFYDRELAQVSVRPEITSLSATPIMLLSGSVADLHTAFGISDGGSHDGLDWAVVIPRNAESDVNRAEVGFKSNQLVRMIIGDRLGQRVTLDFSGSSRNAHVDPSQLQFTPPPGVDVIGTPQH